MSDKNYVVISVVWNDVIIRTMTKIQIDKFIKNNPDTQVAIVDGELKKRFTDSYESSLD